VSVLTVYAYALIDDIDKGGQDYEILGLHLRVLGLYLAIP